MNTAGGVQKVLTQKLKITVEEQVHFDLRPGINMGTIGEATIIKVKTKSN